MVDLQNASSAPGRQWLEHSAGVAATAARFAGEFGGGVFGEFLGWVHDLGKLSGEWQQVPSPAEGTPPHSRDSAAYIWRNFPLFGRILAYPVYAHHGSLPDYRGGVEHLNTLPDRISRELPPALQLKIRKLAEQLLDAAGRLPRRGDDYLQMLIRMLFSCLTDADRLDDESAMDPASARIRGGGDSWETLERRFAIAMRGCGDGELSVECRRRAELPPGFFSLEAPPGSGKIRLALEFALLHRRRYGKRRIVLVFPEISGCVLPERELRRIFGSRNVAADWGDFSCSGQTDDALRRRWELAGENFERPLAVTSNLRLLAALLGAEAGRVRGIHNLVNSVLIFKDVQLMAPGDLNAVLSALRLLVESFGCSVVFAGAPPPVFCGRLGSSLSGLPGCRRLLDAPGSSVPFSCFRNLQPQDPAAVAEEAAQCRQVLCIANRIGQCRELYEQIRHLREDVFLLSPAQCPAERRETAARICEGCRADRPLAVVATPLWEGGAPVEFPDVFRAVAGFDSLALAAGCCRGGGRDAARGRLRLFRLREKASAAYWALAETAAETVLRQLPAPELTPESYARYFMEFYHRSPWFDQSQFEKLLVRSVDNGCFDFSAFAGNFNRNLPPSLPVIVDYGRSRECVELLRRRGPSYRLLRRLRDFAVPVSPARLEALLAQKDCERVCGIAVQCRPGLYRRGVGLEIPEFLPGRS